MPHGTHSTCLSFSSPVRGPIHALPSISLEALSTGEVAGRPKAAGVPVLFVRGDRPDQLRLAPVDGREERLEHGHVVAPDRLVDAETETNKR